MLRKPTFLVIFPAILIFILSFIFYFLPLDRPFVTRGEAREALVVQAMVEQGNYILPLRGGIDIPSKPPMFHWLAIIGSKLGLALGLEQAVRFPSPFLAALLLSSFFVFLSRYAVPSEDPPSKSKLKCSVPLMSVLIAALSFEFFINTTHARVDMCFTFWLFVSLFCLFVAAESYRLGGKPAIWKYILCGVALSGAILSKGPTGLLIPLIIIGAYVFLIKKPLRYSGSSISAGESSRIKRFFCNCLATIKTLPYAYIALSVVIALLIAGSWYYLGYLEQGSEFLYKHLIKENFARLGFADTLGTVDKLPSVGHEGAAYLSILFPLVGFLPWSIFLPLIVIWLWHEKGKLLQPQNKLVLFSVLIVVIFIALVAVSTSKRMVYLLPVYLPLSYLFAECIARLENSELSFGVIRRCLGFARLFVLILLITSIIMLIVLLAFEFSSTLFDRVMATKYASKVGVQAVILTFQEILSNPQSAMVCFFLHLISALALLMAYLRLTWARKNISNLTRHFKRVVLDIGMAVFAFYVIGNYYVLPAIFKLQSPKEFAAEVLAESENDCQKYIEYNIDLYTMSFYMNKPIRQVRDMSSLSDDHEDSPVCLLVPEKHFNVFENNPYAEFKLISQTFAANGKGKLALIYLSR